MGLTRDCFIDVGHNVQAKTPTYPYLRAEYKKTQPVVLSWTPVDIEVDDIDVYLVTAENTETKLNVNEYERSQFIYSLPHSIIDIRYYDSENEGYISTKLEIKTTNNKTTNPNAIWVLYKEFVNSENPYGAYTFPWQYIDGECSKALFEVYKYNAVTDRNEKITDFSIANTQGYTKRYFIIPTVEREAQFGDVMCDPIPITIGEAVYTYPIRTIWKSAKVNFNNIYAPVKRWDYTYMKNYTYSSGNIDTGFIAEFVDSTTPIKLVGDTQAGGPSSSIDVAYDFTKFKPAFVDASATVTYPYLQLQLTFVDTLYTHDVVNAVQDLDCSSMWSTDYFSFGRASTAPSRPWNYEDISGMTDSELIQLYSISIDGGSNGGYRNTPNFQSGTGHEIVGQTDEYRIIAYLTFTIFGLTGTGTVETELTNPVTPE